MNIQDTIGIALIISLVLNCGLMMIIADFVMDKLKIKAEKKVNSFRDLK